MVSSIRRATTGEHPDLIAFTIRYHLVFSTRERTNLFSSAHREPIADLVQQSVFPLQQTTVNVLWLASDHLHLYIDSSPEYALDAIVSAMRTHLEQAMITLLPALEHDNQSVLP